MANKVDKFDETRKSAKKTAKEKLNWLQRLLEKLKKKNK